MHSRITMAEYEIYDWTAGMVFDVGTSVEDVLVYYRVAAGPEGVVKGVEWVDLEPPKKDEDGKKEKRNEGGVKDREHLAWDLALLFPPTKPATSTSKTNPAKPSAKYTSDTLNSPRYHDLVHTLDRMQHSKVTSSSGRNTWQSRQSGGQGEPFYRDPQGFETAIQMTIEHGRAVYREKWGHRDCDIYQVGLRAGDAWRVEKDWED